MNLHFVISNSAHWRMRNLNLMSNLRFLRPCDRSELHSYKENPGYPCYSRSILGRSYGTPNFERFLYPGFRHPSGIPHPGRKTSFHEGYNWVIPLSWDSLDEFKNLQLNKFPEYHRFFMAILKFAVL